MEMIKSLLHTLIFLALQCYSDLELDKDKKLSRHEKIYSPFMALLFQHYKPDRNLQFYAGKVFLTPNHFSIVITRISAKTASE